MKYSLNLTFILFLATLASCEFSFSSNKDQLSGSSYTSEGLDCAEVIIELNGIEENRTEFIFGEKVDLTFKNISGLTEIDGKTYPGVAISILKNGIDTVFSNMDLMPELNNGTDLSPLKLTTFFRAIMSYRNDEKYKIHIKIWDKKGDGSFLYELPFTMKKNELFEITNNNLKYKHLYLWNQTKQEPVLNDQLNATHQFVFFIAGIEGMEELNKKVFPIFSIEIIDNNGMKIVSESNLFAQYETEGIDPEILEEQLTGSFSLTEGQIANPCSVNVILSDKNSNKSLSVFTELSFN